MGSVRQHIPYFKVLHLRRRQAQDIHLQAGLAFREGFVIVVLRQRALSFSLKLEKSMRRLVDSP